MGRDFGQWIGLSVLCLTCGVITGICLERHAVAGEMCPGPRVEVVVLSRTSIQRIAGPDDGGQTAEIWPEYATFNAPGAFASGEDVLLSTALEEYR